MFQPQENHWYDDYENIILTTRWLADRGDSADAIAYFIEKPWHYENEFRQAKAKSDRESAECFKLVAPARFLRDERRCTRPQKHDGDCGAVKLYAKMTDYGTASSETGLCETHYGPEQKLEAEQAAGDDVTGEWVEVTTNDAIECRICGAPG